MTASLISEILTHYQPTESVEVIIDRSLNGIQREEFDEYLLYKIQNRSEMRMLSEDQIEISHVDSQSEPCIQAVDFIAGAIHEHYWDDGGAYYPFIEDQVVTELIQDSYKKQ